MRDIIKWGVILGLIVCGIFALTHYLIHDLEETSAAALRDCKVASAFAIDDVVISKTYTCVENGE